MSNVPKLRFKEFSGEWEEKPLSQVAGMKAGKFVKASDISNNQEDKMYPCYGGNGLRGYVKSHTHNGTYPLIGRQGALCGNIQLASGKFHATEHAVVVTPTDKNDILWLYYELDRLNLNRFATGQAQPGLSVEVIQQVKTNIPLKQEQEKIASFLTSVDTKIEQLTKKECLLQQYKKGVMQKIFNQEIRFKADDGSEFCDWEETSLRKIFKERKLYATKADSYEHISLTTEGVVPKSERYERDFLVSDDSVKKYKVTKLDDICYNPANLKFGVIARNKYTDAIFSPIYVTFEVVNADINFIEYFVTRLDFINKVRKYEEGTVYERQAVKPEDFLKFSISIPSMEEQTKIANFLSSIDSKIEQVQKQLASTKEFKKALLQQMFV